LIALLVLSKTFALAGQHFVAFGNQTDDFLQDRKLSGFAGQRTNA
jgi:hypothetical protein